jgi:hypothetical protein
MRRISSAWASSIQLERPPSMPLPRARGPLVPDLVAIRTDQRLVVPLLEVQVIGLGLHPGSAIISPQLTMAADGCPAPSS